MTRRMGEGSKFLVATLLFAVGVVGIGIGVRGTSTQPQTEDDIMRESTAAISGNVHAQTTAEIDASRAESLCGLLATATAPSSPAAAMAKGEAEVDCLDLRRGISDPAKRRAKIESVDRALRLVIDDAAAKGR